MQGLRPAEYRRQCLNGHADDIVVRMLGSQRRSSRLRVKSKHARPGTLGMKALSHRFRPDSSCRAKFRNLLEEIVVRIEKERNARGKRINFQSAVQGGL